MILCSFHRESLRCVVGYACDENPWYAFLNFLLGLLLHLFLDFCLIALLDIEFVMWWACLEDLQLTIMSKTSFLITRQKSVDLVVLVELESLLTSVATKRFRVEPVHLVFDMHWLD